MTNKVSHTVGTWFCVPLREGGYAQGVIARVGVGGILFGYFFGEQLNFLPESLPADIHSDDRILWGKFGDNGLINGEWKIIGIDTDWKNEEWPMPAMIRVDERAGIAFLSKYDDSTLHLISEERCDPSLLDDYPYDRLMGYGAVEIRLTKLLKK